MLGGGGLIDWAAPPVSEFTPKSGHNRVVSEYFDVPAFVLFQHTRGLAGDHPDKAVFAIDRGKGKMFWLLANRPSELPIRVVAQDETAITRSRYPLLPLDHEVKPDSSIKIIKTTREIAFYYRDLFAHKLGVTNSEVMYLMLLDGYVLGVFGIMFRDAMRGRFPYLFETFGFNVHSTRHKRIHRLYMMCLVCGEALDTFNNELKSSTVKVTGFQTTCITTHPELKSSRGIFKLMSRERRPDGRYRLIYYADFNTDRYSDVIAKWLPK